MSRNPIQMQKGLSLRQLQEKYGTEDQCEAMVRAWRWPDGFVCPHCGSTDHAIVGKRRLYECHACRKPTSLKAGTVFENTMLPLTVWFQGMYLLTQAKNSISGLELARQLGVRPDTASLMRHKLMSVMVEREGSRKLEGRVEMDDAVLGGVKHLDEGGKRGRIGPNKTPFVVAVETSDDGHPWRLLLHVVKTHDGENIEAMARAHLSPTARVVSDGLGCFRAVMRIGCGHEPMVAAQLGWSEQLLCFRWAVKIERRFTIGLPEVQPAPKLAVPGIVNVHSPVKHRIGLAALISRWTPIVDQLLCSHREQCVAVRQRLHRLHQALLLFLDAVSGDPTPEIVRNHEDLARDLR